MKKVTVVVKKKNIYKSNNENNKPTKGQGLGNSDCKQRNLKKFNIK